MKDLVELLNFITFEVIVDTSWFDVCQVSGVNASLWPECFAKKVWKEYEMIREKEGHSFSSIQLSGSLEKLNYEDGKFPKDKDLFKAYYKTKITEYLATDLANKILSNPIDVEKHISNFILQTPEEEIIKFAEVLDKTWNKTLAAAADGTSKIIIPRWPILSNAIGGFNPGRVSIISAATGFGKTTLAANIAIDAAKEFSVIYFNMEMIPQDFSEKLIMTGTGSDFHTIKTKPETIDIGKFAGDIYSSELYFSSGRALTTNEIFSICRRKKQSQSGLNLIIVDYDQKLILQTTKEIPEWKALQIATENFEALAKELNCHVIILAQENDSGDVSGSKRSKFPTSAVLRFHKNDEDVYLIETLKNRFGKRGVKIEIQYEPEKSFAKEKREYIESRESKKSATETIFGFGKNR